MATYRIHRLRESSRQQFRWAPHAGGATMARPRDYEQSGAVEADSVYKAWAKLREDPGALSVGDILESETGELRIFKYVGFESAAWQAIEPKPDAREASAASS